MRVKFYTNITDNKEQYWGTLKDGEVIVSTTSPGLGDFEDMIEQYKQHADIDFSDPVALFDQFNGQSTTLKLVHPETGAEITNRRHPIFETDDNESNTSNLGWVRSDLSRFPGIIKRIAKRGFHMIMAIPIFLVSFVTMFVLVIAPWGLALGSFLAVVKMWTENPLGWDMLMRYVATTVLVILFPVFVFSGFAMNDYVSDW